MKHSFLLITVFVAFSGLAFSQDPKSNSDVDTALRIYKERVSEGATPTLILKNGEAKITETQLPAGELALPREMTTATTGGEFKTAPSQPAQEIHALKDQVETLKKLNAALEKELADCKPNH